jgi:hypothetical protein
MNLAHIESKLRSDRDLQRELQQAFDTASLDVLDAGLRSLSLCFREMTRIDHLGHHAEADRLEAACFDMAAALLGHIDRCGITKAIGRASSLVRDFSYVENRSAMFFDHMVLVDGMGIPSGKVDAFWTMVDQRRGRTIDMLATPGFELASLLHRKRKVADESMPEWAHLMRPWVLLGGVALGAANIAGAIGTLGIGTPLCAASGVAAGAGIADGIFDK